MKKISAFLLVTVTMIIVVGCSTPEEKAQQVVANYFEEIYIATPTTMDEELSTFYSDSDAKEMGENIKEYIDRKFKNTYTDKFEKQIIGEGYILSAALVAKKQNAHTSLSYIKLKRINEKEDDFYFDFEGNVKIDYVEEKENDYAYIHGQISVIYEDGYKLNSIRYYSDELRKDYHENKFSIENIDKQSSESIEENNNGPNLKIGEEFILPFHGNANDTPSMNDADYPEFQLEKNDAVVLIELSDEYAKVQYKELCGWIPKWYLLDEAKKIQIIDKKLMMVIDDSKDYLYPGAKSPKYDNNYVSIHKGKVVIVEAEYGEWICVNYLRYSEPLFDNNWIKSKGVSTVDPNLVLEGHISENAVIYDENLLAKEYFIEGHVIIKDIIDGYYLVYGGGGQTGYIRPEDFNPILELDDWN